MRKLLLLAFAAMLCLGIGLVLSCDDDDDDDDSSGTGPDDDGDDDDSDGALIDNGDGTVTDPSSGLMWEDPPSSEHIPGGVYAETYCDDLVLGGIDDWLLPSISELRTLIRGCEATMTDGVCGVTDDCYDHSCDNSQCDGCELSAGPGTDGAYWPAKLSGVIYPYWSATHAVNPGGLAWMVDFSVGGIRTGGVGEGATDKFLARCVFAGYGDPDDIWTDPVSDLTWQVAPSSNTVHWAEAITYCDHLTLAGGDWRLPTVSELRTLIRGCDGTVTGGSCGVTDSCLNSSCQDESCTSCAAGDGPNNGCYGPSELSGECDGLWSSSVVTDGIQSAWTVEFDSGNVDQYGTIVNTVYRARCVR